jgi:hypothetical protein
MGAPQELNIDMLYDLTVPLLVYHMEMKSAYNGQTYIPLYIVLFIQGRIWIQGERKDWD